MLRRGIIAGLFALGVSLIVVGSMQAQSVAVTYSGWGGPVYTQTYVVTRAPVVYYGPSYYPGAYYTTYSFPTTYYPGSYYGPYGGAYYGGYPYSGQYYAGYPYAYATSYYGGYPYGGYYGRSWYAGGYYPNYYNTAYAYPTYYRTAPVYPVAYRSTYYPTYYIWP